MYAAMAPIFTFKIWAHRVLEWVIASLETA
jgi:hypothetical protein